MSALNKTFSFLKHDACNLDVALGRFVKCRGDDLGVYATAHIGYLLGAFINEKNHDIGLGMVFRNGIGDIFEQYGLAGFRRSYNKTALALADWREHVDHACGDIA